MLQDKLKRVEKCIQDNQHLSHHERQQLLSLTQELFKELNQLEKEQGIQAHAIVEHIETAAEEALHKKNTSATRLSDVIQEFEVSHPNLTRIVQAICAQFGV